MTDALPAMDPITPSDTVRALRMTLCGLNADFDGAQAVLAEAGRDADGFGYVRLAMCAVDIAAVTITKTVGLEHGRETLLNDIQVNLDQGEQS